MDISQTEACESLCLQEHEDGCCYLGKTGSKAGCHWRNGGRPSTGGVELGTVIECSLTGTSH